MTPPDAIAAFPHATGPGVVAVSGGADSVALLRGLLEVGVGPVSVAHFHHQLRPEADADAAFVRDLAAAHGVPFDFGTADVRAAGGNLEATARRLRYAWLREVAAAWGAAWVATGHTANDNAETVLHHLTRGTGLDGLRGVAPVAGAVVRPLLGVTRGEVLAYLTHLGQPFVTDATNFDPSLTRVRIRAELLPLLETFNPQAVAALGRLARQADELAECLRDLAADLLTRIERPRVGGVVVLDAGVTAMSPVVHALLQLVWAREDWPRRDMDDDAWRRAAAVLRGELTAAEFPGRVRARRRGAVVHVGPAP